MAGNEFKQKKMMGTLLLERNLVTEEQLVWAMDKKETTKKYLGQILVEEGIVPEEEIQKILCEQKNIDFLDLKKEKLQVNKDLVSKIPPSFMRRFKLLPYNYEEGTVLILAGNLGKLRLLPEIEKVLDQPARIIITLEKNLDMVIANVLTNINYRFDPNNTDSYRFKKIQTIDLGESEAATVSAKRLGEMLMERGMIDQEQLDKALSAQPQTRQDLSQVLLEHNLVSDEDLMEIEALLHGTLFIDLVGLKPKQTVLRYFSIEDMNTVPFIPVDRDEKALKIAVPGLSDLTFFAKYQDSIPLKLQFYLAKEGQIRNCLSSIDVEQLMKPVDDEESRLARIREKRVGNILIKMGYLKPEVLERAWKQCDQKGILLSEFLIGNRILKKEIIDSAVSARGKIDFVDLKEQEPDLELFRLIPPETLKNCLAVPLKVENDLLEMAIADDDAQVLKGLEIVHQATHYNLKCSIGDETEILRMLIAVFPEMGDVTEPAADVVEPDVLSAETTNIPEVQETDEPAPAVTKVESDSGIRHAEQQPPVTVAVEPSVAQQVVQPVASIVREPLPKPVESSFRKDFSGLIDELFLNRRESIFRLDEAEKRVLESQATEKTALSFHDSVLLLAARKGVTDIHFEPFRERFRIRFRADGDIKLVMDVDRSIGFPVISRIKELAAGIDTSEKKFTQYGRTTFKTDDAEIHFKVTVSPGIFGESAVLRVLTADAFPKTIDWVGMDERNLYFCKKTFLRKSGLILFAGLSDSGRTSTGYALLSHLAESGMKIVTVENHVEFTIPGAIQMEPVYSEKGEEEDLAAKLDSAGRMDPDIIFIDGIDNPEVAEKAVNLALCGNLVAATIAGSNTIRALVSLIELGVDREHLSQVLSLVNAQVIYKKICEKCRVKSENGRKYLGMIGLDSQEHIGQDYFESEGCVHCENKGYSDRTALHETLEITPGIRTLIARKELDLISDFSIQEGMIPLEQKMFKKTAAGEINIKDFVRFSISS